MYIWLFRTSSYKSLILDWKFELALKSAGGVYVVLAIDLFIFSVNSIFILWLIKMEGLVTRRSRQWLHNMKLYYPIVLSLHGDVVSAQPRQTNFKGCFTQGRYLSHSQCVWMWRLNTNENDWMNMFYEGLNGL